MTLYRYTRPWTPFQLPVDHCLLPLVLRLLRDANEAVKYVKFTPQQQAVIGEYVLLYTAGGWLSVIFSNDFKGLLINADQC